VNTQPCPHNELRLERDEERRLAIWHCVTCGEIAYTGDLDAPPPAYRVLLSAGVTGTGRFTEN